MERSSAWDWRLVPLDHESSIGISLYRPWLGGCLAFRVGDLEGRVPFYLWPGGESAGADEGADREAQQEGQGIATTASSSSGGGGCGRWGCGGGISALDKDLDGSTAAQVAILHRHSQEVTTWLIETHRGSGDIGRGLEVHLGTHRRLKDGPGVAQVPTWFRQAVIRRIDVERGGHLGGGQEGPAQQQSEQW